MTNATLYFMGALSIVTAGGGYAIGNLSGKGHYVLATGFVAASIVGALAMLGLPTLYPFLLSVVITAGAWIGVETSSKRDTPPMLRSFMKSISIGALLMDLAVIVIVILKDFG